MFGVQHLRHQLGGEGALSALRTQTVDQDHWYDDDDDEPKCLTCRGRGAVNPLTAPPSFQCTGTAVCPDCDGTGEGA